MTAENIIRQIERVLRAAIDGRRAARALADWTKRCGLNEAEFQILWRLRSAADGGLDQTRLAQELALSAAQISATVERLRAHGWISSHAAVGDRRRHLWQLAPAGREQIEQLLRTATALRCEPMQAERSLSDLSQREAAA